MASSGVALAVLLIGLIPFQLEHPWNWVLDSSLSSMAAYRRETAVYAFNFATLFGGLNPAGAGDAGWGPLFSGRSDFADLDPWIRGILRLSRAQHIGLLLFRLSDDLWILPFCTMDVSTFTRSGPIVLAVPLALESAEMMGVFSIVTLTCRSISPTFNTPWPPPVGSLGRGTGLR